jgi:hypothetical protein
MEFWLSRSLFHELFLFSRWNFGYHTKPFLTNFFFFHDGISAITEPFLTNFFFHDGILSYAIWGNTLFIYISKEYLHRIRLVKNLSS